MDRKLYYGKDAEFQRRADTVLEEIKSGKGQYYDADELADIADYFALNNMHEKMRLVVEYGIHLHPDNLDIRIQEAYMHLDFNELDKAEECLLQIPISNREVKQLEALLAYRKGDEAKAYEILDDLIANASPEDTYAIVGLLLDLGRPEEALDYLTHSDEDPEHEFYLDNLATCYRELDMLDQAIETLNKLIDRYPYQPNLWKVLGECYFDAQQYDKCIEACDFALATDEDYHPALLLKALAFQQLENPEEAMKYVRQAYELGGVPFLGLCYFEMTNYYSIKQWEEVMEVFAKTLKYAKDNHINLDNHYVGTITAYAGISLLHMKRWDEASEIAKSLSLFYKDTPELWFIKAVLQMQQRKKPHRNWERFRQSNPQSVDLVYEAYVFCMDFFQFDEAFHLLKLTHEMDPENTMVSTQLLMHCVTFQKVDTLKEILNDGSINAPRETVDEMLTLFASPQPDLVRIMELMSQVINQLCPEFPGMYELLDEKATEFVEENRELLTDLLNKNRADQEQDSTSDEVIDATPKKRKRKKKEDSEDKDKDKKEE